MADKATLNAQKREVSGKKVKQLRRKGIIPANLSGLAGAPIPIQVDEHDLTRFFKDHPRATLVGVAIAGMPEQTAMIGSIQREPVGQKIQHVEFRHVEMNQPMRARVPFRVMGESTAVKNGEGIVLLLLQDLEVEALPANIPEVIVVDVTGLPDVGNMMHVGDLFLPHGVNAVHANAEEPVVRIGHVKRAEAEAAAQAPEGEASAAAAESGKEHDAMAAQ